MRAVADNAGLAASSGINVRRLINATWVISGGLAGIAGIALAVDIATYSPSTTDVYVFLFFAAVVVGGVGDVYGAMFGGLLLGILTEVSTVFINSAYKYSVALFALIIVILVRPQGIFGSGRVRMR
jgi:branched-subunit amino acid ABC-type transport system permease component